MANKNDNKQEIKTSPLVEAALLSVPRHVTPTAPGQGFWGNTAYSLAVLRADSSGGSLKIPRGSLGITLFPKSSADVLRGMDRVEGIIRKKEASYQEKGKDIPVSLRQQLQIISELRKMIQSSVSQCFAASAAVMFIGTNSEVELVEYMTSSGGAYQRPEHGWAHALQGVVPTSPPATFPDPAVFWAATDTVMRKVLPKTYMPRSLPKEMPTFYIGIGSQDKSLVTWTPWEATNPLLAVMGTSGSGKSVIMRLIMYQAATISGIKVVIFDPKGEWPAQVKRMGHNEGVSSVTNVLNYGILQPPGLLRMALNEEEIKMPAMRASTLFSMLGGLVDEVTEQPLRKAVSSLCVGDDWEKITWTDVYNQIPQKVRDAFIMLSPDGAYANFFSTESEPIPLSDVTVIGVEMLTAAGSADRKTNDVIMSLLLLTLAERLKSEEKALLGLDEAHAILGLPATRAIMSTLMRVARSYGLGIILASQGLRDLYGGVDDPVDSLAAQCATRIILRPSPSETNFESYGLGDYKASIKALSELPSGCGLYLDSEGKMTPFFASLPSVARNFCIATKTS